MNLKPAILRRAVPLALVTLAALSAEAIAALPQSYNVLQMINSDEAIRAAPEKS